MEPAFDESALIAETTYKAVRSGGKGGQNVTRFLPRLIFLLLWPILMCLPTSKRPWYLKN
jgi:hypothetical protein